jgi:hypothetical protein
VTRVVSFAFFDPLDEFRSADTNAPGQLEGRQLFGDPAQLLRADPQEIGYLVERHDLGLAAAARDVRDGPSDGQHGGGGRFAPRQGGQQCVGALDRGQASATVAAILYVSGDLGALCVVEVAGGVGG